jgi:cell wall-associated NlpC family hydrolase
MVVLALSCGCAATGARPEPFPRPSSGNPSPRPVPDPSRAPGLATGAALSGYEVSGTALGLRGVRYKNGGADPGGFDCSGLVQYVFAQHGLGLPRTVTSQFGVGAPVAPVDLQAGDLVFFGITDPRAPTHVGIIVGGDSFVHAPASSGVVRVERLGAAYWASRFVGARRPF